MLLKKSFRVIREGMKGCVVLVCLIIVFVVGTRWDPFGYGQVLPQQNDVASVRVFGGWTQSGYQLDSEAESNAAQIASVIALHESAIQNKKEIERIKEGRDSSFMMERAYSEELGYPLTTTAMEYISISYTMKNGKEIAREYQIPISTSLLRKEGSPANRLDALINQPEWILNGVFAGVWAHHNKKYLEDGDIEEAMSAAHAVGDDAIQKRTQGHVVPDSFTHGTSEQRKHWFMKGYTTGDIRQGNTFADIE